MDDWGYSECQREAFVAGVEWADARQKIVRDLHRAECPGLDSCGTHPVVTVAKGALGGWMAFPPHCDSGRAHATFAEAIAAVHNMTGDKA